MTSVFHMKRILDLDLDMDELLKDKLIIHFRMSNTHVRHIIGLLNLEMDL